MELYILVVFIFLIYHQYKFQSNYPNMLKPKEEDATIKMIKDRLTKLDIIKDELDDIRRETRKRDIKVIHKVDHPPERRLPYHIQPPIRLKNRINIPTRGYPDRYTLQGILVRKSDEKTLQLFGRQKYPGSSQWEYYAVGNDGNAFSSKLPVEVYGDKELYDNDMVELPYLDGKRGKFKVKLYKLDAPRYIP